MTFQTRSVTKDIKTIELESRVKYPYSFNLLLGEKMAKTKKDVNIYHLIILDRSGSMGSVKLETIKGVNTQIESMRSDAKEFENQEHVYCLVTFGGGGYGGPEAVTYDVWKQASADIKDLTAKSYITGGGTPMCDAIGGGINGLRNEIVEELKNEDTKVFVNIFTDGYENTSQEFSSEDCKKLIEEVQATGQWVVAMVGCEDNVFEEASKMGISQGNTVKYARGGLGTQDAMQHLSRARHKMSDDLSKGLYSAETTMSYMADTVDISSTTDESADTIVPSITALDINAKSADTEDKDNG
jgi:uncharacterized protein YegL